MVNHRGCPTTSLEDAREWRECYANNRASVVREIEDPQERSTALIPFATAREMAWDGYDAILDLVVRLPKNVAAECNPADPQLALTVLESECTSIHWAAYEIYTAWSKVRPHISAATDGE
jgi:hypothetical protein